MKKIACLLVAVGLLSGTTWAQTPPSSGSTNSDTPGGPPPGGHMWQHPDVLSDAEKQELLKAHDAALMANPALAMQGGPISEKMGFLRMAEVHPDADLMQAMMAYQQQLRAAMEKADPGVAAIFTKLDAARPHHRPPPVEGVTGAGPTPPGT